MGRVLPFSASAWNDSGIVGIVRTLHGDLHLSFFSVVKAAERIST